jgi:hypothetical protein
MHRRHIDQRSYWLARCEGFRVDSADGRFGLVEAVMFRTRPDEADALVVRAGVLGRRLVIVPIDDIGEVVPRRKRLVLARIPEETGFDFVTQVRSRLRRLAAESAPAPRLRGVPQPEGS